MRRLALLGLMVGLLTPLTGWAADELAAPAFARAGNGESGRNAALQAKWSVCVDLETVEVEESKAFEIIPHLQSENSIEAEEACDRVQAMLKTGKAKLVAWPMVRTVDGSPGVSETALERRYASGFVPPQEPQTFSPYPERKPGHINAATVESPPIAFETRIAGVTLQIAPRVLPGGAWVHVELSSISTKLLAMQDFGRVLTVLNTLVTAPQPLWETLRSDLNLDLKSGRRQLIAVHRLAKPGNTFQLDFVRAVITKVE